MNDKVWKFSVFVLPLFFSIVLHEIAHGFVAWRLGDDTAKKAGRLTLNPVLHFDPIGSFLVPMVLMLSGSSFLFGWAKPVPVSYWRLDHPKKDMGLVALAGPLMNFILAIVCGLVVTLGDRYLANTSFNQWLIGNFAVGYLLSLSLCAFNLFPVLPLDGGRIMVSLLPKSLSEKYAKTERYGFVLLGVIFFVLPSVAAATGLNVDILSRYMDWMQTGLLHIMSFII